MLCIFDSAKFELLLNARCQGLNGVPVVGKDAKHRDYGEKKPTAAWPHGHLCFLITSNLSQ